VDERRAERMPYLMYKLQGSTSTTALTTVINLISLQNPAVENRQVPAPIETINLPDGIVRVETTDVDFDT
jgi:hypothetical protein